MGSRPLGLGALLENVRREVIIIIIATRNEHGYDRYWIELLLFRK